MSYPYRPFAIGGNRAMRETHQLMQCTNTSQGKRIFIKDMAYYLMAPDDKPTQTAPSLGEDEPSNPTVLPLEVLKQFQFTFLIRHPRRAIPSYYRCTVPPLDEVTGFYEFMPNEAGYRELVRFFDFLIKENIVDKDNLVVIDADDLLDNPEKTIRLYCEKTGIDFKPEMLEWNEEERQALGAYRQALSLARQEPEKRFLEKRLAEIG